MEESKKIWLVVVLITLILGLVGYIVYDKVLKVDNIIPNNNQQGTTTSTTTTKNIIKEEKNEFELKKSYEGIDVVLKYNDNKCSLTINNKNNDYIKNTNCDLYMNPTLNLYKGFVTIILADPLNNDDSLIVFDYEGNTLFDDQTVYIEGASYLSEKWGDLINQSYYIYDFKINENKINYVVKYHNDACQFNTDNCSPNPDRYLSCSDIKELGENGFDTRNYEIIFNGKSFDDPKLVSSIKLKDSEQYSRALENCQ